MHFHSFLQSTQDLAPKKDYAFSSSNINKITKNKTKLAPTLAPLKIGNLKPRKTKNPQILNLKHSKILMQTTLEGKKEREIESELTQRLRDYV